MNLNSKSKAYRKITSIGGIKNIALVSIGLLILFLLISRMGIDFSKLPAIKNPIYLILAALMVSVTPLVTALRMTYFLAIVGVNAPMKEIVMVEYINKFLYHIAPFKLNVPAKAVILNKTCGVRKEDSASIVTFEYGLDVSITLMIGCVCVVIFFKNFSFLSDKIYLLFLLTFCLIAFFWMPIKTFDEFLKKAEKVKIKLLRKILTFILNILRTIRETWVKLAFSRKILWAMLTTAMLWILNALAVEALFLSLDYHVPLVWILATLSCGILVSGATTIPGGLGVREATMVFLYSVLGVPQEISIIVVLLSRLLTINLVIIGYLASLRAGIKLI